MDEMSGKISHLKIIKQTHYGRMLSAILIGAALAFIIYSFAVGKIEWDFVAEFFTVKTIVKGILNTIILAFLSMALGIILGVIFAIMRMSKNPVLSYTSMAYIWFFRAVPALLQLLIWFNLALIFPKLGIYGLYSVRTIDVMTPFVASLLALGIQQGAFTAEVVRAGLLSVDSGQYEAAKSVGMPYMMMLRRIIMPQAMRMIVPPVGNEFIGMVKLTSLASVIQFEEILHSAQNIYYANSRVVELLIVAAGWYLIVVTILNLGQFKIEQYYSKGARRLDQH